MLRAKFYKDFSPLLTSIPYIRTDGHYRISVVKGRRRVNQEPLFHGQ